MGQLLVTSLAGCKSIPSAQVGGTAYWKSKVPQCLSHNNLLAGIAFVFAKGAKALGIHPTTPVLEATSAARGNRTTVLAT
jgi:hypothetical protein